MNNQSITTLPVQTPAAPSISEKLPEPTLTGVISSVCSAVYLSTWFTDIPVKMGTMCVSKVLQGEVWRVGTNAFLHENIIHLMMNLGGLKEYGPAVEKEWGARGFAKLAACAIVANTATDLLFGDYSQHALGLSAVLFALAGATHIKNSDAGITIDVSEVGDFWIHQLAFAALANCIGLNLSHQAHLSGYLAGMAFSYFSKPENA